ncbi:MAG: hypothetical protein Q8Q25_00880 [bacterium]|nr:hypothetical protein [bacterium]
MNKIRGFKGLMLVGAFFVTPLISAYCVDYSKDSKVSDEIEVIVFPNRAKYEAAAFFKDITAAAAKRGEEYKKELKDDYVEIRKGGLSLFKKTVNQMIQKALKGSQVKLTPGTKSCVDWKKMVSKVDANKSENEKKVYYFVILNSTTHAILGSGQFEIGGQIVVKLTSDAIAYAIYNTDNTLRYETPGFSAPTTDIFP